MRLVIQRVSRARVTAEGETLGEIGRGYLILLGIGEGDTRQMADRYVEKLSKLRIFPDENGKTNRSIIDVGGEVMVVSQFTLYADCRHGNRPGFSLAASPEAAKELYEYFVAACAAKFGRVAQGSFGAHMKISLENDGPFTIFWDSKEW